MKPIWSLGFRPFFLFGSIWGGLQIMIWVIFQTGWLHQIPYRDPIVWHVHEMVFGFAAAIVAGFILTASQNWAGIPGISGTRLMGLVALWSSARLLSIVWNQHPWIFAITDLAFFPTLALCLRPYLWQESQKRNHVFFLLFLIMFGSNLVIHVNALGILHAPERPALLACIFTLISMISLIGGRVIPFFTSNAIAGAKPEQDVWIEKIHMFSIGITGLFVIFWEFSIVTALIAFTAGIIQTIRYLLWRPWKSVTTPILFILYLGYLWIPIGLFLRAFASMGWISTSISSHAFTAGAIGIMIYGMITRVALGHTGRKIHASKSVILGYILIFLSALVRVFGPLILPKENLSFVQISGWLWFFAFAIYVAVYAPVLSSSRPDGKSG